VIAVSVPAIPARGARAPLRRASSRAAGMVPGPGADRRKRAG